MKKSYFWLIVILILLTTYTPKSNFLFNSNFYIKKIEIENNVIIKDSIYDYDVIDGDGNYRLMSEFKGKILIITNTARDDSLFS